jgi:hypothetical protein
MKVRALYIDPDNIIRKHIVKYLYATGIKKTKTLFIYNQMVSEKGDTCPTLVLN